MLPGALRFAAGRLRGGIRLRPPPPPAPPIPAPRSADDTIAITEIHMEPGEAQEDSVHL